jgi:hypothetical protein
LFGQVGVLDFSLGIGDALVTQNTAGIDYLAGQNAGDVSARYPHAQVDGIDADAGVGFAFLNTAPASAVSSARRRGAITRGRRA